MKSIPFAIALSTIVLAAAPSAQAQLRRGSPQAGTYPTATNVPAGMCQVWIDGLPPNRQPAPTDCATARANAPAGSRIIYGPGSYGDGRYDPRNGQYGGRYPGERRRHGRGSRYDDDERGKGEHRQNGDWNDHRRRGDRRNGNNQNGNYQNGNYQHDDDDEWDDDGDHDDDHGYGQYGQYGQYDPRGRGQRCLDTNRDGVCDYYSPQRMRAILGSLVRMP